MPSRDELYQALRNADKAGDAEGARKLAAYIQTLPAETISKPNQTTLSQDIKQGAADVLGGLVRGAGSIGSTILAPIDMAKDALDGKGLSLESNRQRRQAIDQGLTSLIGSNPDSMLYKGGKLTGEIAGTAGTGGILAKGAQAVGTTPSVVNAIASGGFSGGGNALSRAAAGATVGAASAGLVDPENAPAGAVIGGALPGAVQLAGKAGNALSQKAQSAARDLMQAAIKPTIAQRSSGEADTAIDTLLKYGISPTKAGVNKLQSLIGDLNSQIADSISNSSATVSKSKVANALSNVRNNFSTQVSPTKDLNAVQGVADDFLAHPNLRGDDIPVQQAQQLKQGTYRVLSKKYGEAGSAETEAQKALARGLKEEIATAVPGVGALNAEESKLLTTLNVAERRALLEANKNPMGLAALAKNPLSWAAFMADRSSAFKALAARIVNRAAPAADSVGKNAIGAAANPLVRTGLVDSVSASP